MLTFSFGIMKISIQIQTQYVLLDCMGNVNNCLMFRTDDLLAKRLTIHRLLYVTLQSVLSVFFV